MGVLVRLLRTAACRLLLLSLFFEKSQRAGAKFTKCLQIPLILPFPLPLFGGFFLFGVGGKPALFHPLLLLKQLLDAPEGGEGKDGDDGGKEGAFDEKGQDCESDAH